jgi:alcohol dehydrogenase (cytochrome c)
VLYFTTDTSTYAVDAATCRLKWRTGRSFKLGFLKNNHGVSYMGGRLFRVSGDVHAYALDAETGRILWDVEFKEDEGEGAPMAPLAWNGLVFVGNSGGDNMGVQGHLHALDVATGREVWSFDVVPDTGAASRTWPRGNNAVPPTGGGMWTSLTLDPVRGVLYVPTGNAAPDFIIKLRPGENLYTNSIVALDAKTGKFLGHIQTSKNDYHDWDVSAAPALFTTRAGRAMLALPGKDGLLHGILRDGDKMTIRYSVPTTTRLNTTVPLTHLRGTRFCPGTQGGTEWNGAAYNPGLNLIFTGAVDWCATIRLVHPDSIKLPLPLDFTGNAGGGFGQFDPKERWQGWITAVNADAGTVSWKHRVETPVLAAVTTTAGNLVLTGDMNGNLIVLDARTGTRVYRGSTGAPIGGGVITYDVGGRQYIAVAGGSISPIWPLPEATSRITVFALR